MDTKKCKRCEEEKSLSEFHYRKNRNCYESNCRKCDAEKARERRKNKGVKEKIKQSQKKYYEKNKKKLNETSRKYHNENKDKLKAYKKKYYQNNAEKYKEQAKIQRENIRKKALAGELEKPQLKEKKCTGCNETQKISNFTFRKTRNIYDSRCKTCNRDRERKRREMFNDKINARRRNKVFTPQERIGRNLRSRVNSYVKHRTIRNTYLILLGCTKKFLFKWFEYNFKIDEHLGMNWDNYGNYWHIDHVTPCSAFDLKDKEQQQICFHWTNLCPVPGEYNLSKSAQIRPIDNIRQEIRIKQFLKNNNIQHRYTMLEP